MKRSIRIVPPSEQGIYTPTIIARNQIKPTDKPNEKTKAADGTRNVVLEKTAAFGTADHPPVKVKQGLLLEPQFVENDESELIHASPNRYQRRLKKNEQVFELGGNKNLLK